MNLKEARQRRKLTQEQLADQSGVEQSVISKLETGDSRSPSWETVGLLCHALKMNPYKVFPIAALLEGAKQEAVAS